MDLAEEKESCAVPNQDVDVKEILIDRECPKTWCQYIRQNLMMILMVVGICLGFGLGLAIRELQPSEDAILWIGMPGDLYMRLLKMTIMPLVVCSVIAGASSLDPKMSGKMGAIMVLLVVITNIIACCIAAGFVVVIRPGAQSRSVQTKEFGKTMKTHDAFADLLRNLMPENIVEAAFRQSVTKYIEDTSELDNAEPSVEIASSNRDSDSRNRTNSTRGTTDIITATKEYTRVVSHADGVNILGLITISAVFGIAAGKVKKDVPVFLAFIENVLQLVIIVVQWFFWLTPIGVLSLIAKSVSQVDNLGEAFSDLGLFVVTVVSAIVVHWVVVLPVVYTVVVRKNPLSYFIAMLPPVSIAFAATTSTVAIPEMLKVCENKFNMDNRVTRIGIPFCITVNGDGSGIFIVTACLFISDYSGIEVTPNIVLVTLLLTFVTSMSIPGVPSASIITVIITLTAIQVPVQHVAILFALEWILDRVRTGLNATSHMTVVACTDALCKTTLRRMDEAAMNGDLNVDSKMHNDHNTFL